MTIDPTIGSAGAINALSATGGQDGGHGIAGAVQSLASDVIGQVAASLGLAGQSGQAGQGDIYGLGSLADGMAYALGDSSATGAGELNRALEEFASAVATDMAAYADGRTLDIVESALAADPFSAAGDVAGIIRGLEQATAAVDAARRS